MKLAVAIDLSLTPAAALILLRSLPEQPDYMSNDDESPDALLEALAARGLLTISRRYGARVLEWFTTELGRAALVVSIAGGAR